MPLKLDPVNIGITLEPNPVKVRKLGESCDLSNDYVDVSTGSCVTAPSGQDHQLPGSTRSLTCNQCHTSFTVTRSKTTGGFSTATCPSCNSTISYMGLDGTCQSYGCGGSCGCSSYGSCPTKRVIDECELEILNDLICQMRAMLKDGNTACYAFSAAELSAFLDAALSEFNGTPTWTNFTWKNIDLRRFRYIICEGAVLMAMGAQVLIEAGREFTINENGITFNPAQVSSALQNQYSARYQQYKNDLDKIKENFKASPTSVLSYQSLLVSGNNEGGAPQISRLRHLRGRRVF